MTGAKSSSSCRSDGYRRSVITGAQAENVALPKAVSGAKSRSSVGKVAAWAASATFASVVIVAPLQMLDKSGACLEVAGTSGYVGHICVCYLAIALAVAFGKLRKLKSAASIWIQRYAISFFVFAVCTLAWSWFVVVCPDNSSTLFVVSAALRHIGQFASYGSCQLCLAKVSVVRVQWMAEAPQASQTALLFKLSLGVCALFVPLAALAKVVQEPLLTAMTYAVFLLAVAMWVAFQVRVFSALLHAAWFAHREARRTSQPSQAAKAALFTAIATALSFLTSIAVTYIVTLGSPSRFLTLRWWFFSILVGLDQSTDVGLAILCSGLVTAAADQERNFKIAGDLAEAARRRKVLITLKEAARALTGPSVSLAALFEGMDPEDLLEAAVKRFRCVSWNTLQRHPYLILGAGPLDGATVAQNLYNLSEPCRLARCDAFFSHSWHDDPWQKWQSLAAWCQEFSEAHGRQPYLWFDKVCVDQSNIATDLQCLPIFLAGCNSLLVSCGRTYTTRLWCCVELFVFMKMARELNHDIHVIRIAEDNNSLAQISTSWASFDVRACECFLEEDKQRILQCIEKEDGAEAFNTYIRSLAANLFDAPPANADQQSVSGVPSECDSSMASI
eukprot:TRINITY_DN15820_c1_g1_i3.p1 TRINITY_DN15820_c1_g1~~TRINITY_DN15820_c1_g1_i3.p1  ORF type:complete len:719 (+),score=36.25 TRINITY_DN15820_c1_g1_i3:309-2159(+)